MFKFESSDHQPVRDDHDSVCEALFFASIFLLLSFIWLFLHGRFEGLSSNLSPQTEAHECDLPKEKGSKDTEERWENAHQAKVRGNSCWRRFP